MRKQLLHLATTIFLSLLLIAPLAYSEVINRDNLTRDLEPVVVRGSSLGAFIGTPENQIFAFVYRENLSAWVQIPLQINEKAATDNPYFDVDDATLSDIDELAFMAKDLGDQVSANTWINDPDARANPRYEIEVIDGLDPLKKAWVYLYKSSTYLDTLTVDYVNVNTATDTIFTPIYKVGHNANGLFTYLSLAKETGGWGPDIVDRQKARLKGRAYNFFDYNETEEKLSKKASCLYKDGKVRVIRRIPWVITMQIPFLGTIQIDAPLTSVYYLYSSEVVGTQGNLTSEFGCKHIRYSIDLTSQATGMKFYNSYNADVLINGSPDNVDKTVILPGVFWTLVTGSQGTLIQLASFDQAIGDSRRLYYQDNSAGGTDDGTVDTGEDGSYGDSGLLITSATSILGSLKLATNLYYLKGTQDGQLGATLANNLQHPFISAFQTNLYDGMAPAQIYLVIGAIGATSVTLVWYAPGDDGYSGGNAVLYDLRYSTTPVGTDTTTWWNNAIPVSNLPAPAAPYTREMFTVEGLTPGLFHFFAIRAKDDAGNWSRYSNIPGAVVPVELVSFEAIPGKGWVELRWNTASETNNHGFEVQRKSQDSDFETIAFVKGTGTTSSPQQYHFVDQNVSVGTYAYRLKQIDTDGNFQFSQTIEVTVAGPRSFALEQNYPNPFNLETVISYAIPTESMSDGLLNAGEYQVSLKIYNTLGQEVRTLVDASQKGGYYLATWDGRDNLGRTVASGIYIYRIAVHSKGTTWTQIKKMLLLP